MVCSLIASLSSIIKKVAGHNMNLNAKYLREQYERTLRGNADFFISKAPGLTRGRARFKHGGMLALLKYHFYPLFILDNGMNLISKITICPNPGLIIGHFHICTYILEELRFAGFWPILEHKMTRPVIER